MNDKEMLAKGLMKLYPNEYAAFMDGSYKRIKEAMVLVIREARQDERKKLEAENAGFKKEIDDLNSRLMNSSLSKDSLYAELREWEFRWDKLEGETMNYKKLYQENKKLETENAGLKAKYENLLSVRIRRMTVKQLDDISRFNMRTDGREAFLEGYKKGSEEWKSRWERLKEEIDAIITQAKNDEKNNTIYLASIFELHENWLDLMKSLRTKMHELEEKGDGKG